MKEIILGLIVATVVVSCSDSDPFEQQIAADKSALEAAKLKEENTIQPINVKDPSSILSDKLVRRTFVLPETIVIRQESRTSRYAYMWTNNKLDYDLEVSFWMPDQLNEEEAKKQFEAMKNNPTDQKMHPEKLTIGDAAQFSETAGGHLIVRVGNNILDMYLSGKLSPLEDPQIPYTKFTSNQSKAKLVELAEQVINRIN